MLTLDFQPLHAVQSMLVACVYHFLGTNPIYSGLFNSHVKPVEASLIWILIQVTLEIPETLPGKV